MLTTLAMALLRGATGSASAPGPGPGLRAPRRRETLHAGQRASQTLPAVLRTVEVRTVGPGIVEDGPAGPEQAFVALQPAPPRRRFLGPPVEVAGAAHDALVAPPVPFQVTHEVPQPVARPGMRAVVHDGLLETPARPGGQPLPAGEGADAFDEPGGAVEVERMHTLFLRPAEMLLPLPPEPAIGRLRKLRCLCPTPGGLFGRRASGGGLPVKLFQGRGCGTDLSCAGLRRVDARLALRFALLRSLRNPLPLPVRRRFADDRAPELAGPGMHFPQLLQLPLADAGALGQQALEGVWARPERCSLLQQRAVPVEGVAESLAIRYATARGGRVAVIEGAAGSGKTTTLRPITDLHKEHGYEIVPTAVALGDDCDARPYCVDKLLKLTAKGQVEIGRKTLIVVDEAGCCRPARRITYCSSPSVTARRWCSRATPGSSSRSRRGRGCG